MIPKKQYVALSQVRFHRAWATVGELAERLQASHHGTVALIQRCKAARLVHKRPNFDDSRRVEVHLTHRGRQLVERIAKRRRMELRLLRDVLRVDEIR